MSGSTGVGEKTNPNYKSVHAKHLISTLSVYTLERETDWINLWLIQLLALCLLESYFISVGFCFFTEGVRIFIVIRIL